MGNRAFWILVAVLAAAVTLLFFQRQVEEAVAPELRAAWVAIEVLGPGAEEGLAQVGRVELEPGTPFRLHAVVEGRRGDEPVYYTEAPRLTFGDDELPPELLRRWERSRPVKVRWFSVEGRVPYLPLDASSGLEPFELQEFQRSDWPLAWTVDGTVDAAHDDHFDDETERRARGRHDPTGTLRYHVRFELYRLEDDLLPARTFASWGAEELEGAARDQPRDGVGARGELADRILELFPTAVAVPTDRSASIARLVGLTQVVPPQGAEPALLEEIGRLADRGLVFSRGTALRDLLRSVDRRWEQLSWREIELGADDLGQEAETLVAPGDLIRVGDRVVVFARHADSSDPEAAAGALRLDGADLCYDFLGGLTLRRLDAVFEGGGLEVASLVD